MNLEVEKKLRNEIYTSLVVSNLAPIAKSRNDINIFTKNNFGVEIHKGERGVWRNATRTKEITHDDIGLAVSIHSLSEGPYDDSHSLEIIKYAFPNTKSLSHDVREIESMKNVLDNELPLFIIVGPKGGDKILRKGIISSANYKEKYWEIEPVK